MSAITELGNKLNFKKYFKNKVLDKLPFQENKNNQYLAVIFAVGILFFIIVTTFAPFKNQLFSMLYPKPSSKAFEQLVPGYMLETASSYIIGSDFPVKVWVKTSTESAKFFSTKIGFQSSIIKAQKIDTTGSFINKWTDQSIDNINGVISLAGETLQGYTQATSSAILATITFSPSITGQVSLLIDPTSSIKSSTSSASVAITSPPQVIQIITAPTPSPTATSAPITTPLPVGTTEWPQLQHDPQHTGRTSVSVTPDYEVAWAWFDKSHIVKNFVSSSGKSIVDGFEAGFKFTTMFSGQLQPIVYSGKTYFGAMDGTMYAVNALTGDNIWEFKSGGPIMATAAADQGMLIFDSMDGKIYGLNASTGIKAWEYQTEAGINAPPIISNSTVYVGSRDGKFYALNLLSGAVKWSYTTRVEPADANSGFNKAPIVSPAALSEDGSIVFFGAENMFFYALNTSNGSEKWSPRKLVGQSFLYTWPVVKGDKVIIRTMSSLPGVEFLMEPVLDGLTIDPTWSEEKSAILGWLIQDPHQKTMYVFDVNTGNEPYQVAMGRVTGNNFAPHLPVVDNSNRVLTYWRTKRATLLRDEGTFGTKYCPDISAMDLSTGDRVKLTNSLASGNRTSCPKIDNGFQPTIGGDWLYMHNHFRGAKAINVNTASNRGITGTFACRDGACWRGGNGDGIWGYQIIYYGNDSAGPNPTSLPNPDSVYSNSEGFAGISIAQTGTTTMLYINEGNLPGIVAVRHKP